MRAGAVIRSNTVYEKRTPFTLVHASLTYFGAQRRPGAFIVVQNQIGVKYVAELFLLDLRHELHAAVIKLVKRDAPVLVGAELLHYLIHRVLHTQLLTHDQQVITEKETYACERRSLLKKKHKRVNEGHY